MTISEKLIRTGAINRIALIFGTSVEEVRSDMKFADDFRVSFVSDFRRNEFDCLNDDIRDVADRKITKDIDAGILTIATVSDYCNHMVRCYPINPKAVTKLLLLQHLQEL